MKKFINIGIIKNQAVYNSSQLEKFLKDIDKISTSQKWNKSSIIELFNYMLPDFNHIETGKYLDGRM